MFMLSMAVIRHKIGHRLYYRAAAADVQTFAGQRSIPAKHRRLQSVASVAEELPNRLRQRPTHEQLAC
jgi:hypothetical protein